MTIPGLILISGGTISLTTSLAISLHAFIADSSTISGESLVPAGLAVIGLIAVGTGAWRAANYFGAMRYDINRLLDQAGLERNGKRKR